MSRKKSEVLTAMAQKRIVVYENNEIHYLLDLLRSGVKASFLGGTSI